MIHLQRQFSSTETLLVKYFEGPAMGLKANHDFFPKSKSASISSEPHGELAGDRHVPLAISSALITSSKCCSLGLGMKVYQSKHQMKLYWETLTFLRLGSGLDWRVDYNMTKKKRVVHSNLRSLT
jgi:hypothetical protein